MAKQTFMSRVKAYRKLHPRCSQIDAMKKLKGTTVSGTRKKSTSAKAKTAKPKKRSITETKKVTVIGSTRKRSATGGTVLSRGLKIIRTIDNLELKYKATKSPAAKKLLATVINAEHDKLDRLQKQAKLKSA